MDADDEPGVPGQLDEDGRPYFSPSNQCRPADGREQREGFIPRWEYRGHKDSVKDVCVTGEDEFGRVRFVSTDGKSTASWLELSHRDSKKLASGDHIINALVFIPPLNVVAAASGGNLLVFDGRTLRMVSTLPTSNKVLLQLEYNRARDEIISGGSDGCFAWRLEAIPCELYALEVVPFELKLLCGFKGFSNWAGKMIWDEASQIIITIDGVKVKTYDAVTALNLHTIQEAHESPVTAGLWVGESEHIVTGCMGGCIKVWACQHTDVNGGNNRRRRRRRRRERTQKARHGKTPALEERFEGHSSTITGLVRHSLNRSYIVSCGADGTLRVWDVDRLAPVTCIRLPCAVTSLWALLAPGGRCRVVYAEAEGSIQMMAVHQICRPVSFDTEGARNVCYFPPLADSAEEPGDVSAIQGCDEALVGENRSRDPPEVGLVLVQMNQGLWGLVSELTTTETCATQTDKGRGVFARVRSNSFGEEEGDDDATATLQDGNTTSSLFYAWPPLSCVVERYSHHVLSRRRRKVFCLADSGVLDSYLFGPGRGEARKAQSRKVDLRANGATATCMCLLPDTPACVVDALDRAIASHRPSGVSSDGHAPGDGRGGGDTGGEKGCRDRRCSGVGPRLRVRQPTGEKFDQVVAVGTSRGDVLLVETVVNGTTLDFLEGVFSSKVFHMAFCSASTEDAIRGELVSGSHHSTVGAKDAKRLVCAGYNANGTVAIKGLALPSLAEMFCLHLVEVPTCVRVARRRPILAVGFADGALNVISFQEDRVRDDVENGALIGAHTEEIHTISFNTLYGCMATGSADGHITIWDLNGQQLHTIHLQTPALAVEFLEVSGDLLVSSSSGMSCIPPSRWCPLRLLVAKERAERRAAAASNSSIDGISRHVLFASMMMQPNDATASERGVRVRGSASTAPRESTLCKRPRRASEGCGDADDRRLPPEGVQALHGNSLRATRGSRGRGDIGREEEKLWGSNDARECAPPAVAGVGDEPEVRAPSRLTSHLTLRKASGPGHRRKFSILDRMKTKFSSMPTSPPPPTSRTTKARTCLRRPVTNAPPASPPMIAKYCRRDRASTGDRCNRKGATPTSTRNAPSTKDPNPRDGGTTSTANDMPSGGAVLKWTAGAATQEMDAGGGSEAWLPAPARAPDALRLPLSGSFLNGVKPYVAILEQDAAARNIEGPDVPLSPSSPRQRCTPPVEDCVHGVGLPTAVSKKQVPRSPRNAPVSQSGLQTTTAPSNTEKGGAVVVAAAAAATATALSTPDFTASGYTVPEAAAQPPEPERGPHMKTTHIDQGLSGPENEASVTEGADGKHHPLLDDLSSDQTNQVPAAAAPSCRPPSWEDPSDIVARNLFEPSTITLHARKRHRPGLEVTPMSVVDSLRRSIPPGWTPPAFRIGSGEGTAAAFAAKDVQNVVPTVPIPRAMPTAPISRAMVKPCLVADLVDKVPLSPPSPSPPVTGGRAFGVISPLSWSADASIGRLLSTPRMDSLCLPRVAASPDNERRTPSRNNGDIPASAGSSASFFPVRPRAGRRTPVPAGRARCHKPEVR